MKNLFEYLISVAFGILLIVIFWIWLGGNLMQRLEAAFNGVPK